MLNISLKTKSILPKLDTLFRYLILICLSYIIFISCRNIFINLSRNSFNKGITSMFMTPHSLLIDENNENITYLYYRHVTSIRNSSYPFISGDTFRAISDYTFDEIRRDKFQSIKYGDIVFIKADMLDEFFDIGYRLIKTSFILISHNSDFNAPGKHITRLNDKKIIAWYASNPNLRNHSKLFPIPIGLPNLRWPNGNLKKLTYAFENHRKPWSKRTTLLYVNFNIETNEGQRQLAFSQAKSIKDVQIIDKKIAFEAYLEQLGNAKFVLSPPGNGLDCHRTWEALLLGAAPVVLTSTLDSLFYQIPVVIIDNWKNLTENLLLSYNFEKYDNLMPAILYARYWRETLFKYRGKTH